MQQDVLCPKCGASNAAGLGFCANCGSPLQFTCPNCSTPIDSSNRFCPVCGAGLGWGMRFRDLQSQITQAENGLRGLVAQNANDFQGQLRNTEEGLKAILGQYTEALQSHQLMLNSTSDRIAGLVAEEHSLSLSRKINRIGTGVIGGGLAVVGLAYVMGNAATLAMGGVGIAVIGFLMQLVSLFISTPKHR